MRKQRKGTKWRRMLMLVQHKKCVQKRYERKSLKHRESYVKVGTAIFGDSFATRENESTLDSWRRHVPIKLVIKPGSKNEADGISGKSDCDICVESISFLFLESIELYVDHSVLILETLSILCNAVWVTFCSDGECFVFLWVLSSYTFFY